MCVARFQEGLTLISWVLTAAQRKEYYAEYHWRKYVGDQEGAGFSFGVYSLFHLQKGEMVIFASEVFFFFVFEAWKFVDYVAVKITDYPQAIL